jgi:hypothetical protein
MNRSEKNFRKEPDTPAQLLASLAGQCGVELKPSGYGRLIGLCPFHNEKTPSFVIFPEGRFYCFGCKEHGDAIDFVRKQQGLSYLQALNFLGRKRPDLSHEAQQQRNKNRQDKLKAKWRESDLAWTLSKLIRLANMGLKALTPENFEAYGEVVGGLADWERWHDILISGSREEKAGLMKDLKYFQIFERGRLWREDFDYRAWLKSTER